MPTSACASTSLGSSWAHLMASRRVGFIVLGLLLLAWPSGVYAEAFTWSGAGNLWSVPGNWTPEGVPKMAGDTATITTGGANGISLDIDPTLDSFTMNSAAKSLTITGHTITVTGPSTVDAGFIQLNSSRWASAAAPNALQVNANARLVATGDSSIANLGILKGRLTVTGTNTDGATLTIGKGFLNDGNVTLNTDAASKQTILTAGGNAPNFVNTGTVTFQGTAGSLKVVGELVNGSATMVGSMAVNANTTIEGQMGDIHQNNVKGTITIAKDTSLTFTGQSLRNFGTIQGNGTLDVRQLSSVNPKGVINSGFLKPGSSPGILTINGDYTQVAGGGTLAIEINGPRFDPLGTTDYSRLVVNGSGSLDGLLAVTIGGGFTPQPTDTFTILTSTSGLDGFFENALPPTGSNVGFLSTDSGSFEVVYNESPTGPGSVVLEEFQPVPEPTTLLLVGTAMTVLGLAACWKRRRQS